MKIAHIDVHVCHARMRNWVFVKVLTDQDGLFGWGEATLEWHTRAVVGAIQDFAELVVGEDPTRVEHLWQMMFRQHFWHGHGIVRATAMAGIDLALWDILGKVANLPCSKLWGGPVRDHIRTYCHLGGGRMEDFYDTRAEDAARFADLAKQAVEDGFTAFKSMAVPPTLPIEGLPPIRTAEAAVAAMREAVGENIDIMVDCHARPSPAMGLQFAKALEPYGLYFLEEPCWPECVDGLAMINRAVTTPIATGERLVAAYACRELIEMGVVDILQPDINHVGGITALWKTAAMAAASGITMAPHNCEGPIGGLATIAVDAAMPNFLVQEVCSGVQPEAKEKIWEEWLGFPAMRMVNGRFPLLEKPGLGFDLTEDALKKYPFTGTRPMPRIFHTDGSVAEW